MRGLFQGGKTEKRKHVKADHSFVELVEKGTMKVHSSLYLYYEGNWFALIFFNFYFILIISYFLGSCIPIPCHEGEVL